MAFIGLIGWAPYDLRPPDLGEADIESSNRVPHGPMPFSHHFNELLSRGCASDGDGRCKDYGRVRRRAL